MKIECEPLELVDLLATSNNMKLNSLTQAHDASELAHQLDRRMDSFDKISSSIENAVADLEKAIGAINSSNIALANRISSLENAVVGLEKDNKDFEHTLITLKSPNYKIHPTPKKASKKKAAKKRN
jgi:predicted  nucleic acid-binding Zn-ribbon protein